MSFDDEPEVDVGIDEPDAFAVVGTDLTMPVEKLKDCVELAVTWILVGVEDCVVFLAATLSLVTSVEL
jgi:hypothetical protein